MNREIKDKYINLLNSIDSTLPLKSSAIEFINSYEGDNIDGFEVFLISIVGVLRRFGELEIESEGYIKLKEISDDLEKQSNLLKEDYKDLQEENIPIAPPAGTFPGTTRDNIIPY